MDIIFKTACFLLPFENLFFAPSEGWATVSPVIMFFYVMLNLKDAVNAVVKYKKIIFLISICLVTSCINYLFIDFYYKNIISTFISLGLGITCLLSFDIYLCRKRRSLYSIEKIIIPAYYISLFIGWIQYFVIKLNISFGYKFFGLIEKRSYIRFNRVQFTFTEPSFIGMHLFGILLPVYFVTKNKKILRLIIIYSISAVLTGSGVRVLLDIMVVVFIILISKIDLRKIKNIIILFFIPIVMFGGIYIAYTQNPRVQSIVKEGIYADGSLATRFFRIDATVRGYMKDGIHFIFGYGMGNELIPLKKGYYDSIKNYRSSYLAEVIALGNSNYQDESVSYCLFTRIISEAGIVVLLYIVLLIFYFNKRQKIINKCYFPIFLYLYLQFESYAFYTLWFYIVLIKKGEKIK